MVRSDIGASGVMFTLDTESGFRDAVFITASYGLGGEMVVQGRSTRTSSMCTNRPGRRPPAILRRNVGSKAIKMIYAEGGVTR